MYEKEKREIINAALEIKKSGLISLSGGNVSIRKENGHVLVTPSGMSYEGMQEDDIIVLNLDGTRVEGTLRESVDTIALLYIYSHLPEVNAIIHTHQPYATAVGLIEDVFPAAVTTLANVTLGAVNVAPYSSPASLDMGIQTVEHIDGQTRRHFKAPWSYHRGAELKRCALRRRLHGRCSEDIPCGQGRRYAHHHDG